MQRRPFARFTVASELRVEALSERNTVRPGGIIRRDISAQPQPNDLRAFSFDVNLVVCGRLRSGMQRVHGLLLAVDNVLVDAVLDVRAPIGLTEDPTHVCFIFCKQQRNLTLA